MSTKLINDNLTVGSSIVNSDGTSTFNGITLNAPDGSVGFLKAENGYTYLPNGMLLQWGFYNENGGGWSKLDRVSFPKAFNVAFSVIVNQKTANVNPGIDSNWTITVTELTNTSFAYKCKYSDGYKYWIAIGY